MQWLVASGQASQPDDGAKHREHGETKFNRRDAEDAETWALS